jgi:hypothetical protein
VNARSRIDADADVRAVARGLGIKQTVGLAEAVRDATICKVETTLISLNIEPRSIAELREVIHHTTGLQVVRIESDADLEAAQQKYASELRGLPKQLAFEFANDTEALVVRRPQKDKLSNNRFIALVDARGDRGSRAWFGEWHEATHTLVPDPANNQVLRRTRLERPQPLEQVIDLTAAALGFWAPIVKPVLEAQLASGIDILDALDRCRAEVVNDASREATFRALSNFVTVPVIILWVGYGCRAEDEKPGGTPSLSYALRAKTVIRNGAALTRGMNVPVNFRIPPDSTISRCVDQGWGSPRVEADNLSRWKDSTGRALRACPVKVTARGRWAAIEAVG